MENKINQDCDTRETANSEFNNRNNSHHFEHLGMENKINQDCEAVETIASF